MRGMQGALAAGSIMRLLRRGHPESFGGRPHRAKKADLRPVLRLAPGNRRRPAARKQTGRARQLIASEKPPGPRVAFLSGHCEEWNNEAI